jgi:pimeloyl-ACP methyl ester carboxylesterase
MSDPIPFIREAGAGPGVICLHSNASSSSQWRALMETLAPDFHVWAPDGFGAGRSPAWPADRVLGLHDEVALIEPVFAAAGEAVVLVGHSYGAAVALKAALMHPGRVRALALFEPTLFSLLDAASPQPNEADGIRRAVAGAQAALAAGDPSAAAGIFIDYWMGPGAWAATPEARRGPIVASIVNVGGWGRALLDEPATLDQFARLDVPVLLMTGRASPASSRGVARLLAQALPRVQLREFDGLGHMGPVTHPEVVNAVIADFLTPSRRSPAPPTRDPRS